MSLRDWRAVRALGRHPCGLLAASCGSPDSGESGSVSIEESAICVFAMPGSMAYAFSGTILPMRKSTCNELAALLAQLKQSTERANASLDATLRYLDEGKSGQVERDQAARTRALTEFMSTDFAAISDALGLTHDTNGVD